MDKKVIIITGSSRGLGFAIAKEFLKLGHNVVFNARSQQSINSALQKLTDYSSQISYYAGSVTNPDTHKNLIQTALNKFNKIDIWINNAAIPQKYDYFVNLDEQQIIDINQINITGVMLGTHQALKFFSKQKYGAIWNLNGFGSDGDTKPKLVVYGTTKRAVNYFTKALYTEIKDIHPFLTLGTINPGMVKTQFLTKSLEGVDTKVAETNNAFNEIFASKPEEVAKKIVPLLLSNTTGFKSINYLSPLMVLKRLYKARKVLKQIKKLQ